MGKINREELFKILDEQYRVARTNLIADMDVNIHKLHNLGGDIIDIKTEISMGNTLDDSMFRSVDEDYYDKQKLLSSVPEKIKDPYEGPVSLDKLFWPDKYKPGYKTQQSVTAPPKHKKKYLIKLNDNIPPKVCDEIAEQISKEQFIVYNKDTIVEIITLDVE